MSPNAHDYEQLETIYAHTDGGGSALPRGTSSPRVIVSRDGDLTHIRWITPAT